MLTISPCTRALCVRSALAIALVLGLGLTCQAQNSAVNFTSSQPVFLTGTLYPKMGPVEGDPSCGPLFAGKLHNSTKSDFVTTCDPGGSVPETGPFTSVLLNSGNGFFTPIEDSAIDIMGSQIVGRPVQVTDLNGDGFSDLIILAPPGQGGPFFAVQISAGDGTFQAPVDYTVSGIPSGSAVTSAVTGDFENNGRMDVAVLTSLTTNTFSGGSNDLAIFLNDGTGKFTQSATYALNTTPAGFRSPILVPGDINNDGKVDVTVVYTGTTGTAVPYISQGNGKFTKGSARSAGDSPMTAAWGDFNKDGFGDIAVTTPTGFNIIFGSSSGNFTGSKFTSYPTPIAALNAGIRVVTGDFDRDGNLDLAMSANNGVDIFWGAGTGTFSSFTAYGVSAAGGLVAADIDGDGKLDLAVAPDYNTFNILYNSGGRTFRAAPNTHLPNSNGIVAGDFNRDGKQDVAVVNTPTCAAPCNGTVTVLPGGGAYFNGGTSYSIGMHGSAIAAGDLNADGILDVVVTDATPGDDADVSILLGSTTGSFGPARNLKLGSLSHDTVLADVNGDGKLDLVEDGGVALGDGKGSFGNLTPFPDGIGFTSNTYLAVSDFNRDGHPDIAIAWLPLNNPPPQAEVLINNGKGDFSGTPPLDLANNPVSGFAFITGVAAGPLSGSNNDIVFAGEVFADSFEESTIQVFLNDGSGNFTAGPSGALEGNAHGVVIADFNKDGHNDIGFSNDNFFVVMTGPKFTSGHGFDTALNGFPVGNIVAINSSYAAVADFNKDGWPDVVFTSPYGVSRLYNVPVPTVSPGALNFTGSGSQKVTVKNTTTTTQAITALFRNGTSSTPGFTISGNTCGTLSVGASCTVSVDYNGASNVGTVLYVSSNGQFIDAVNISAP